MNRPGLPRTVSESEPYRPKHAVRFVTAASLFDGHDASINIMRRILQSAGCEVIHLGHNRSAQEIVDAAIQEDAQGIAISSYQGGHTEFFKYIIDLLKKGGAPHIKVFGGGGGTITSLEATELERYGVSKIYSPEDGRNLGLRGIIDDMVRAADRSALDFLDWAFLDKLSPSPRLLASALTALEEKENISKSPKGASFKEFLSRISETAGSRRSSHQTCVIGLTVTWGAGKSSLTDEIALRLLHRFPEKKIAIVATDPTRRKTGGALLGDRLRINSLKNHRLFMRSLATRAENAALSQATRSAVELFAASEFDWVFVETGGIGQSDTSLVDLVDIHLYVMTSEYGAATQLEKINMLDYADVVVINKFDKGGSLDALHDVKRQLRRIRPELGTELSAYPVFGTIASRFSDPGVDAVVDHLLKLQKAPKKFRSVENPQVPDTANSTTIVPRDRNTYLSQIAESVRTYHGEVETLCHTVTAIEACDTLINQVSAKTKDELTQKREALWTALSSDAKAALEGWPDVKKRYSQESYTYRIRDTEHKVPLYRETLSRNRLPRIALPAFKSQTETLRFLLRENLPGFFPYTAGVFPFKREEESPKRMFAGEGTPARTNRRFHLLCKEEKAKRLSTAFDSVTLYGQDPDHRPDIFGKVGESGVSVCTLEDAKKLYSGFDLCDPATSVSMTINGPAPILLAFFFNTALDQQISFFEGRNQRKPTAEETVKIRAHTLQSVRGTVQADILKEDQAQNTCIFSTTFALRMMGDIQSYFIENQIRNYYSVSISGYHIAEAGANPISQLAFTLANGFTFVEYYLARGMKIDSFAPSLSFFFSNGLDPEYTVIGRVARRIWAIAMRRLYKAGDRSQKLKYHIQTSGRSLHAQEINFNDIRTTLQALLAYFDHCNSLHTNAFDEAITTPTEESVRRAMAIQLVITEEFGLSKNENPLQGSFVVEELTNLVEEAVLKEFDNLTARGGVLGAMETQYQRSKIQEESLYYEELKHSGKLPIVGVNSFLNPDPKAAMANLAPENLTRASYEEKEGQIKSLNAFKALHQKESQDALKRLQDAARAGQNIFASLMDTARVCSLGQMSQALYEIGGEYRRSM